MKILKKSDVQAEAVRQRQEQIEEGVKLALKIDALRKTLSELEKQHAEFVSGVKGALDKDIVALGHKKEALIQEVTEAEHKLENLRMLPDFEWDKVKEEAGYLGNLRSNLEDKEATIAFKEAEIAKGFHEIGLEKDRIHEDKLKIAQELEDATDSINEARSMEAKLELKLAQANEFIKERNDELLSREIRVAADEKNVALRAEGLDNRERSLNDRERFINDKYQTLIRTEARIIKS